MPTDAQRKVASGRVILDAELVAAIRAVISAVECPALGKGWPGRSTTVMRCLPEDGSAVALTAAQLRRAAAVLEQAPENMVPANIADQWQRLRANVTARVAPLNGE